MALKSDDYKDSTVLRELVVQLVCDTIQKAVDDGGTPREGAVLALIRLRSRGWMDLWLDWFGPSALADQWRSNRINPSRRRFDMAATETFPAFPSLETTPANRVVVTEIPPDPPLPEDADETPCAPRVQHGRPDALTILGSDIDQLLNETQYFIAGIWTNAGEMKRKDWLWLRDHTRERALDIVSGMRKRRRNYDRIAGYFTDDRASLRQVALNGTIDLAELREYLLEEER